LEKPVMIPSTDHPEFDRESSQPAIEGEYFLTVQSGIHEVAGVNKNVPGGKAPDLIAESMSVGNYDKAHCYIGPPIPRQQRQSTVLNLASLILSRLDYPRRKAGQKIFGALIIQEAIQARKPERQSPSGTATAKNIDYSGQCLARPEVTSPIERVYREEFLPRVFDRENLPVLFPSLKLLLPARSCTEHFGKFFRYLEILR